MKPPVAFTLHDAEGLPRTFPSGRPALLAFVKEDCETCNLTLPLIEALHRAAGGGLDVWVIAQGNEDRAILRQRHGLTLPLLDDSALDLSYDADIEAVPTLFLYDAEGACVRQVEGFEKREWQALVRDALDLARSSAAPAIAWEALPSMQPGCGSQHLLPGTLEKIEARRRGDLLSRRIEIAEGDDVHEFLFDQGFTDGLPVVPPTPERVRRMLQGTKRHPQEVVAVIPPSMAEATVEKIAINAVMAGAKPAYLPVILAAVEAACTEEYNIWGVLVTTYFPGNILIVNGPIRHRLDMNMGVNALGQGNRANAAIGRALNLVVRNLGRGKPGEVDRATLGGPHKYTLCFAEWEERSPWEPLHVERGFAPEESTVTLFAGEAPRAVVDQMSRDARSLSTSLAMALDASAHPKIHQYAQVLLVMAPEHVDVMKADGWSKNDLRREIQRVTARPWRDLLRNQDCAEGMPPPKDPARLDELLPKFRSDESIAIVVAGGEAGKFSAIMPGHWVADAHGFMSVTRKIGD